MNIIVSLIGLSPIPNYISLLNYCKKDSYIFLTYSGENQEVESSLEIARTIKSLLKRKYPNTKIEIIESSKSDFKEIIKASENIIEKVKKIKSEKKIDLILDITGSTKANSAIFSSEFSEKFQGFQRINLKQCYLDSNSKKIYEIQLQNERSEFYELENLGVDKKISSLDILALHKFKDTNKIHDLKIKIYLDGFNLLIHKKTEEEKIGRKKEEVFELFYIADKMGGRFSKILYEANDFNDKSLKEEFKGMEHFIDKFTNEANSTYASRLILKSRSENRYLTIDRNGRYLDDYSFIENIIGGVN